MSLDALVREVALMHARARAAEHLVIEDPPAAAQALRGFTRSSGAVVDALRATDCPGSTAPDSDATVLAHVLADFRASGGSVRFAAHGREQHLSPAGEGAARFLLRELMGAGARVGASASLSVSLTWSATNLDLLVVLAPPGSPRSRSIAPVTVANLVHAAEAVRRAGGTLRVETPPAGGAVVAAALPVSSPADATIGP